jgi:dTDP-4-dehydrorhamnose reductase
VRWLEDIGQGALAAANDGVAVRAVTVWALLGSFDWHCLVTRADGQYEEGVFDVTTGEAQPTAAAAWVRARAHGAAPRDPALLSPGWWRRPERLLYPQVSASTRTSAALPVRFG